MIKKEYLTALLNEVEAKFGRGNSSEWKNRDFENLSFEINRKTKTVISPLTLKRIFGKIKTTKEYLPQKATLKALEEFAEFSNKHQSENLILKSQASAQKIYNHKTKPAKWLISSFLTIGLLCFISITYYCFLNPKESNLTKHKGYIRLIKSEGNNPKTCFFEYSTPNNTDSFYINFDENYPPIYIPCGKEKKTTYYFQYPGLYKVRMQKNKQVISDSILVYVPNENWQALGYYFDQKHSERYFPLDIQNCTQNKVFHPTKKKMSDSGMDTTKITVIRLDNYRQTGTDGDNFTLETILKNPDSWSGVRCNSIFLYIEGKLGSIRFRFTNPGCSYWINYRLSEKVIDNQNEDLSNLTFNLMNWQKFRIQNHNRKIDLYINNVRQFSNSYNNTIGEIIGVSIIFHGNGYIKSYLLKDKLGKIVFSFDN